MAAKKGLGKGLDSLITDKVSKPVKPKSNHAADAVMIDINKVEPNREQPRKKFDEDALIELSESIKQFGILQPLLCQERDDYYEIVAGERRWRGSPCHNQKIDQSADYGNLPYRKYSERGFESN